MRYATVGTSWITDAFIEGAEIAGGLELTAVYSRNEKTGQSFASKYGGRPVFTDLELLAKSDLIEAVYIASPNIYHYSHSKLFLENGKHVICEKPITVTSDQYRELNAIARRNKLVYMEAIMMRHLPARKLLHKVIKQIGHIYTARFDFSQLSSKYNELLSGKLPNIFNPALAAGCLMDLGVYCVYAAIDLFGRPKNVISSAGFLESGADGYGTAIFDYDDKQVTLTYSKVGQSLLGSEIIGDKGTIKIDSISKLTGMTLIHNKNGRESAENLIGDIPKNQLMSGEAAAFLKYATDIERYSDEIKSISELALAVNETMELIRQQSGIKF